MVLRAVVGQSMLTFMPVLYVSRGYSVVAAGVMIAVIARRWQYAVPFVLLVPIKLGIEWLFLKQLIERQGWEVEVLIVGTNHSAMPHAGPDFYDLGYTVHED